MDAKSPDEFWQQKRMEYLRLRSPLLRKTPDITQFQPITPDELEEFRIEIEYEIQLEKQRTAQFGSTRR